jgi:translation machinery-associated protein 16
MIVLRIKTLQSYTVEHVAPCTLAEVQGLIEDYLGRDDEELAKLKSERRAGRPPSTRETLLKQNQEQEQKEYVSGFWVPDLEDMENLNKLKDWKGQWSGLNVIKFVRITKDSVRKESRFPPKGLS